MESGFNAATIYKMLNKTVARPTVYRWVCRISKSGVATRLNKGRPSTLKTKTFIGKISRNVQKK